MTDKRLSNFNVEGAETGRLPAKPPVTVVKVDPKCLAARRASITTKADKAMSILRAATYRHPLDEPSYPDAFTGKRDRHGR